MIRIHKPAMAPLPLRERGVELTAELCRKIDAGESPSFDRAVYGHDAVKRALVVAQHDKCCYCEVKLSHSQFPDVEHFRPKGAARQSQRASRAQGYYWLAYSWDNLYLTCGVCNRRHKRDLFPLANPEQRVSSHRLAAELDAERPLLIDPGREDPEQLLEFRREYAAPVAGDERGAATIAALELNRDDLRDDRRERRNSLRVCLGSVAATIALGVPTAAIRDDAILALDGVVAAAADGGEYASMTRALLRQVAPWPRVWAPPAAALLDALVDDARKGRTLRILEL